MHQHRKIPSARNGSVRVDAVHQSRQRHLGGSLLRARRWYNASRCISPCNRCLTVASRSVGLLFKSFTLVLWLTVTTSRNQFIGYALASGLQWDGWRCENLSSRSFYLRSTFNSLITNYTHHSKSPDLCGYWQSIARSVWLLSDNQHVSLEFSVRSRQCYPPWKLAKQLLPVQFSVVQISRRDSSWPRFQVLWCAPGLPNTQRMLHPRSGGGFWIVVVVATGDNHTAHYFTSLGIALPTPSCTVGPLRASSGCLCIDNSEIYVHLRHPQLEPWYHGKYRAPLSAVVHPIYTLSYDSYPWYTPACRCILSHSELRLAYCRVMLWCLWSQRQDAFHHGSFEVPWIRASHMTACSGGQHDHHWKGGLCRWQRCSLDTERGLGDWPIWFLSRECDAERWLLTAGSWDCDWRCSNHPWGSFNVLVHASRQNTFARVRIAKSVQPSETSSGS